MSRRKRVLIKLSKEERAVAGTIFLVLLAGPLVLLFWLMLLNEQELWIMVVGGLCALLISALLVGQVWNAYRNSRAGISLPAFAHALAWFALVHIVYGSWVLATGLTPGKINPTPVPRSYSVNYFLFAALVGGVALAALLIELYRRRRAT